MYNYGQLQVVFDDGSVGWYEAGWGPMMSETAFFVKDVIGPKGACRSSRTRAARPPPAPTTSTAHTKTELPACPPRGARRRRRVRDEGRARSAPRTSPDHQELCDREQAFLLRAIREDLDLSDHVADAVNSLRIVLAADLSVRTGRVVAL